MPLGDTSHRASRKSASCFSGGAPCTTTKQVTGKNVGSEPAHMFRYLLKAEGVVLTGKKTHCTAYLETPLALPCGSKQSGAEKKTQNRH